MVKKIYVRELWFGAYEYIIDGINIVGFIQFNNMGMSRFIL